MEYESGDFPYYHPHVFTPTDHTEICADCFRPLYRHPYWEDEVDAAVRGLLGVLRDLRRLNAYA